MSDVSSLSIVANIESGPGILLLGGETASGKTDLAIRIALRFEAEIISADSRQLFADMPIGTAAPTAAQRARVPHHLIDWLDPHERYSAARFVEDAARIITEIESRGRHTIVVGGTGFYLRALSGDVELGDEADPAIRARIRREQHLHDPQWLYDWLHCLDPARADSIVPNDQYRVVRALESALIARGNHAPSKKRPLPSLPYLGRRFAKCWVQIPRERLFANIAARVDSMLERGFVEEAEQVGPAAVAANAVGYPHAMLYLAGAMDHAELRAHLIRATRRYAKRQATWLRSEPHLTVIHEAEDAYTRVSAVAEEELKWQPRR